MHAWHKTQTTTSTFLTVVTHQPSSRLPNCCFRTFQWSICLTPVWESPVTNKRHWLQIMPLSVMTSNLLVFFQKKSFGEFHEMPAFRIINHQLNSSFYFRKILLKTNNGVNSSADPWVIPGQDGWSPPVMWSVLALWKAERIGNLLPVLRIQCLWQLCVSLSRLILYVDFY